MPPLDWTGARDPARAPWIVAHRGASALAAENTYDAFEAAIELGVEAIEVDARLTADGVPVCLHDPDLGRVVGHPARIAELTLAEARALHPRLPTLAETVTSLAPRIALVVDLKIGPDPVALHAVLEATEAAPRARLAFGVRSLEEAAFLRAARADAVLLGLLPDPGLIPGLAALGGTWARLWQPDATQPAIEAVQRLGVRLLVMTGAPRPDAVGRASQAELAELIERGADAIALDDPREGLVARRAARGAGAFHTQP